MVKLNNLREPVEILLVEDNPADVRLILEAFRESRMTNRLSVVADGEEAMSFLRREGKYKGAPRPDLILLDLKLPRKDGHEVLADIKSDPKLMRIPVLILTASKLRNDIINTYDLHANAYIVKPMEYNRLIEVIRAIDDFWLKVAMLPPDRRNNERRDA